MRANTLVIEKDELLTIAKGTEGIETEAEKVCKMLLDRSPEVEDRNMIITDELRGLIRDMANIWVTYGVSEETRRTSWLITYEPTARRGESTMPLFKGAIYGWRTKMKDASTAREEKA